MFGWTGTGALAEYVAAPATQFAHAPTAIPLDEAAAMATSGLTALQALRDVAKVEPGQTVLNVDRVRSIGADHVIDYATTDVARMGRRFDVILDNVEAHPLVATRRALAPRGTLIPNCGSGSRWFAPRPSQPRAASPSPTT